MPLPTAPLTKTRALLLHLLADLLAHGAAQKIGLAERIAGEQLRRLHHLFLIDDDAEGFLQHGFELGMDVIRLLGAVLAQAIGRDIRHRAGTIERDQRDDVLETVGTHVEQSPPHALTFQLEDADRFRARQELVGLPIIERNARQIEIDIALLQQVGRPCAER